MLGVSARASAIHNTLRAPSAGFFACSHTTQRWSLFPIADPDPWWMHVEGRIDGAWVLLYRPNDPEHATLAELFEYRRVRAIWNPGSDGPRADQPRFVDWIARQIGVRRPEIDAVRVRYLRYHVRAPLMGLSLFYRRTAHRGGIVRRVFARLHVRELWLALGIGFHLALIFTIRLGIFPFGMLALYWAFLTPDELSALASKLDSMLRRTRSP